MSTYRALTISCNSQQYYLGFLLNRYTLRLLRLATLLRYLQSSLRYTRVLGIRTRLVVAFSTQLSQQLYIVSILQIARVVRLLVIIPIIGEYIVLHSSYVRRGYYITARISSSILTWLGNKVESYIALAWRRIRVTVIRTSFSRILGTYLSILIRESKY